jgi:L-alanine-DL-glutamate epimerase-like enolase superfamily enzyme
MLISRLHGPKGFSLSLKLNERQVINGHFALPDKPGLGVDLNESVIAAYPPM